MLTEIISEAWIALKRNHTRSVLTMLGIVWGIATVTLLIAYGSSFRHILVNGFDAFGKRRRDLLAAADQRAAGRTTRRQESRLRASRRRHGQGDGSAGEARLPGNRTSAGHQLRRAHGRDRARCAACARNMARCATKLPPQGRWLNSGDELERRRVVFLGGRVREQLFSGRPAVGETVQIGGVHFTVIGVMARKIQLSNYFSSDDDSVWIPYSAAGDLWNTKYAAVMVFEPIAPQFEKKAWPRCGLRSPRASSFRPPTRKHSRCSDATSSVR